MTRQSRPTSNGSSLNVKQSGFVSAEDENEVFSLSWSTDLTSIPDESKQDPQLQRRFFRYLATCSSRKVSIYQVEVRRKISGSSRSGPLVLKQSYEDDNPNECYYVCAFGARSRIPYSFKFAFPEVLTDQVTGFYSETQSTRMIKRKRPLKRQRMDDCGGDPMLKEVEQMTEEEASQGGRQLLCVAGHCRTIKVIDTASRGNMMVLVGHGDEIWDLKFSPADEWILASASKDQSIRLWNLKIGSCIAILGGHQGHQDSPVCLTWHISGDRIATAGADTFIKIWDVGEGSSVRLAQLASHETAERYFRAREVIIGKPVFMQFPVFSDHKIHKHCVDCIQFVGDLIISKSLEGKLLLWYPDIPDPLPAESVATIKVVRTWAYKHAKVCYVPFALDLWHRFLLVGNSRGELLVWKIDAQSITPIKRIVPPERHRTTFRSLAFCPDGDTLIAGAANGNVCKWDFPSYHN
jgi:polycomb protein EED